MPYREIKAFLRVSKKGLFTLDSALFNNRPKKARTIRMKQWLKMHCGASKYIHKVMNIFDHR